MYTNACTKRLFRQINAYTKLNETKYIHFMWLLTLINLLTSRNTSISSRNNGLKHLVMRKWFLLLISTEVASANIITIKTT